MHATPFASNNYTSGIGEDLRCVSSGYNIRDVFRTSLGISYVYWIYNRDSAKASGVVYGIYSASNNMKQYIYIPFSHSKGLRTVMAR